MVAGLLVDNDVAGHFRILHSLFESDTWRETWHGLRCAVHTAADLGLSPSATDRVIWQECQLRQLVLVTANRNRHGPDSLAAVIADSSTSASLPVITLANPNRILADKPYARRTAERVLGYLLEMDSLRGAERLYVP